MSALGGACAVSYTVASTIVLAIKSAVLRRFGSTANACLYAQTEESRRPCKSNAVPSASQNGADLGKRRTAARANRSRWVVSPICCAAPIADFKNAESACLVVSLPNCMTNPSTTQRHSSPSRQIRRRKSAERWSPGLRASQSSSSAFARAYCFCWRNSSTIPRRNWVFCGSPASSWVNASTAFRVSPFC